MGFRRRPVSKDGATRAPLPIYAKDRLEPPKGCFYQLDLAPGDGSETADTRLDLFIMCDKAGREFIDPEILKNAVAIRRAALEESFWRRIPGGLAGDS